VVALAALVAVLGAVVGPADGAKPGKPSPVDTGLIYYWAGGTLFSMETDGSVKTALSVAGRPSQALHEGERWFLKLEPTGENEEYPVEGDSYPGGLDYALPRHELWITNESGTASVMVSDDATLEPDCQTLDDLLYADRGACPCWAAEDSVADGKVSYVARRWGLDSNGNAVIVERGVYVVALDWESIYQGTFEPAAPTLLDDVPLVGYGDLQHTLTTCDWSPDGTQIVFSRYNGASKALDLWIATPGADDAGLLEANAVCPSWSVKDRIAFSRRYALGWCYEIMAIDPDGGNLATVIPAPVNRKGLTKTVLYPQWSPSGTYLVYVYADNAIKRNDVYRASETGSGAVNLTADVSAPGQLSPCWRP
jgi:WD40 repeat protein